MCSVCRTFSTFACACSGIFKDFYLESAYRGTGVARMLVIAALDDCKKAGISTLWVGYADMVVPMYQSLGFKMPLGNLLAWVNG